MSRYFIPAIFLAAAPLALASAEPAPAPQSTPPANCQQMQQMHHGDMQQQMGNGAMGGSGQTMHHGSGDMGTGHMGNGTMGNGTMGNGAMGSGNMQGQTMQHGDHAGMGPGYHQGIMQGQGQCPAAGQTQDSQSDDDN